MAQFLRDEQISSVTIDKAAVSQLIEACIDRGTAMPEFVALENRAEGEDTSVFLFYTIRFDQKGNRVDSEAELLRYFDQATEVERMIFELKSAKSLNTNLVSGSYLDLRLDKGENGSSYLTISSDDEDWVNGTFNAVKDVLLRHRNRNSWAQSQWIVFANQVLNIFLGFTISLWAASKIAPNLAIENAFLITFLMVLLVFSNLWIQISQKLGRLAQRAFPIIKFYRPKQDRLHWLYQAIVAGIVVGVTLYVLGLLLTYVGEILGGLLISAP